MINDLQHYRILLTNILLGCTHHSLIFRSLLGASFPLNRTLEGKHHCTQLSVHDKNALLLLLSLIISLTPPNNNNATNNNTTLLLFH
jgi:hypothetical protein